MLLGTRRSILGRKGQNAATFVGAYDAIVNLVHIYEPARCTLSAYTGGNLLRLRRDSDDAESDFSHVSASDPELDLAAIAAWAGGASYIVSVYDQVLGDTITQAAQAAQPLFVASIQNGHAGGLFDGISHWMQGAFATGGALSQPFSVYVATQKSAVVQDATAWLIDGDDATNRAYLYQFITSTPDVWAVQAGARINGTNAADSSRSLWSMLFNGVASQYWRNAISQKSGNAGTNVLDGLTVGATYSGAIRWDGPIVSVVIADPAHDDATRAAMQTAMNSYWGIY